MPKVIVAKRIGVERQATKEEVCQHWMVPRRAWSGGKRLRVCAFCGKSDWVTRDES
jgi:hypothetical protein